MRQNSGISEKAFFIKQNVQSVKDETYESHIDFLYTKSVIIKTIAQSGDLKKRGPKPAVRGGEADIALKHQPWVRLT